MSPISQYLASHAGLLLFAAGFAEQSGLPLPGAPILIASGALSAAGQCDMPFIIAWTTLGCIAADVIWFILGQRGQVRVLRAFPHLRTVQANLDRASLARAVLHGTRMLTIAKFLPLGNLIPLHAGAMRVSRWRFLLVDAFCSAVFAAVYASLGYAFHDQVARLLAFLDRFNTGFLLLAVLLAVGWLARKYRNQPARNENESAFAPRALAAEALE